MIVRDEFKRKIIWCYLVVVVIIFCKEYLMYSMFVGLEGIIIYINVIGKRKLFLIIRFMNVFWLWFFVVILIYY